MASENQTQSPSAEPARLEEVRRILREVPLIDGHNDLPWQYRKQGNDLDAFDLSAGTRRHGLVTDIPRLRAGGVGGQFWSVYIPPVMTGAMGVRAVLEQIDLVHELCRRYSDVFELALTADDIVRIHRDGKIASLIGMEGGHSIDNSVAILRMTYALGARYMTLTHGRSLDWADSATDESRAHGLSDLGRDIVLEMNRLGMLVDLSHVSDATMHAVLDVSMSPVIFSHSSARALCDTPRNVPDDVLKRLPENAGLVMITFVPAFLTDHGRDHSEQRRLEQERLRALHPGAADRVQAALAEWSRQHPRPHPTLHDVADHIDHVRRVAGIDHVGIGSDYEGFGRPPLGLEDVSTYPALLAELLRRGYTREDVKKVAGLNLLRVLRETERVAAALQAAAPVPGNNQ